MAAPAADGVTAGTSSSRKMWPPEYRLCAGLFIILAAYYAASWYMTLEERQGLFIGSDIIGGDFSAVWLAARLALDGQIAALYDSEALHYAQTAAFGRDIAYHVWVYPPHILPWLCWLGLLPYLFALLVWTVGTFAVYAFAAAYRRPACGFATLGLALAPASFINITVAQNGFLSAACLAGGLRLAQNRPVLAGLLFGLLTFKPQLGLLVPIALVLGRQWRALISAALFTVLIAGTSLLWPGPVAWLGFLKTSQSYQAMVFQSAPIHLYQAMMPTPFMAARFLGATTEAAGIMAGLFAIGAVAGVLLVYRATSDLDRRSAAVITATFLAAPYAMTYDMTLISAAIIALLTAQKGVALKGSERCLMLVMWLLPLAVVWLNYIGAPLSPLLLSGFLGWQIYKARCKEQAAVA